MNRTVKIYTLEDSITHEIKYVGRTFRSLNQRLKEHLNPNKALNDRRWRWIKTLKHPPLIKLLDEFKENEYMHEFELYYMWLIKSWGFDLVNTVWDMQYNNPMVKSVYQYDLDGNYLKSFISAASIGYNIGRALKYKGSSHGFRWSYDKVQKLSPYSGHFTLVYAYSYNGDFCGYISTEFANKSERKGILSNARITEKRNKNRIGYKGYRWYKKYQGLKINSKFPTGNSKKVHKLSFKLRYSLT